MSEPIKIGIAGLGTVGSGLLRVIEKNAHKISASLERDIIVTGVSARQRDKDRGIDITSMIWFDDPQELAANSDIDVFVELIGGENGIARDAVETALMAGKHVVTANKALLAHYGPELASLAEKSGVALNFEAAVAGGIPIVKAIRESMMGVEISRVYGILNGTCNYILTKMEREGRAYDDVLKEAQQAGYAEADPTFDVGGHDSAHKLALLTSLAFGTPTSFDSIYLEGIETISPADLEAAADLGYRIKLLAVGLKTDSGIEQRVHPAMVPINAAIADVDGVTNCVAVDGDFIGDVMLIGPGAGAGPTAASVMSDIVDIARGIVFPPFVRPTKDLTPYQRAKMREHEGSYYLRLSVHDRPGAFAAIAKRMAEQNISLESVVQRRFQSISEDEAHSSVSAPPMPVIMVTHETNESAIRRALEEIQKDGHVLGQAQMIRIENL